MTITSLTLKQSFIQLLGLGRFHEYSATARHSASARRSATDPVASRRGRVASTDEETWEFAPGRWDILIP